MGLAEAEEPLDLLDPSTARAMHRKAAGQALAAQDPDFPSEGGKIIIKDEDRVRWPLSTTSHPPAPSSMLVIFRVRPIR